MDKASVAERTRRDHEAEYRNYLAFMSGADEELKIIRGYGMLPSERDDYSRAYFAEEYREATRKLAATHV